MRLAIELDPLPRSRERRGVEVHELKVVADCVDLRVRFAPMNLENSISQREASAESTQARIRMRTSEYGALALFVAFREDRIPVSRFAEFFKEQYMTARWFQDVIWAATDIAEGRYAEFARAHRAADSGHHRWMKTDLERFGLEPMSDEDWFRFEWLPTRLQMARILARLVDATAEDRIVVLACMESAGAVTLGTLFDYVVRNGLAAKTKYLGDAHVKIEERQVGVLDEIAAELLASARPRDHETVDLVFDALTRMFQAGGDRYYGDLLVPVSTS